MQRAKRNEQRLELEKVKQRRLEREREREDRAKDLELEQRQRDNEKFSKWERDEDEFHLKQARLRSKIRIIDGRAKPIDLVSHTTKYARILLFQFVFTKYVFGFRKYDGLIFVVFDVIFQNVIMRKYDKIRF